MLYHFISCHLEMTGFAIVRFSLDTENRYKYTVFKTGLINYAPPYENTYKKIQEFAAIENPENTSVTVLSNFEVTPKTFIVNAAKRDKLDIFVQSQSVQKRDAILTMNSIVKAHRLTVLEGESESVNQALEKSELALKSDETEPLLFAICNGISWVESILIANDYQIS